MSPPRFRATPQPSTPQSDAQTSSRSHETQSTDDLIEPPAESRLSRIARRAHEIYEARGGEHGRALEDWLQAEREVDDEIDLERLSDA